MKLELDTKKKVITLLEEVEIIELLKFLSDLEIDIKEWKLINQNKTEWYPSTYYPTTILPYKGEIYCSTGSANSTINPIPGRTTTTLNSSNAATINSGMDTYLTGMINQLKDSML